MNHSLHNIDGNSHEIMKGSGNAGEHCEVINRHMDLSTQCIIAHLDRVVVIIPVSVENVQSLVEKFEQFKHHLSMELAGNDGPTFKRTGEKKDVLQFEFKAEFTKVKFVLPKPLHQFFLKNKRFPTYEELLELKYSGGRLALVEIVDRRKWCPAFHVENVLLTIQILERYFTIEPKTIEVALDTQSPELGMLLRKCVCLRNPPSDQSLFHHPGEDKGEIVPGPSSDGKNEYHGYRPKGWKDLRPSAVRPRGGRRQIYSYDRKVSYNKNLSYTFHRFEIRYFRDYIMPYARKNNLGVYDLLLLIEKLVMRNMILRQIDCEKLLSKRSEARFCNLKGKSTKGQVYLLHKQGVTNKDIKHYLQPVEWPPVRFIIEPKNDDSDVGDYELLYWSHTG